MLFLTDNSGIPSIARWVHLAAAPVAAHPDSAYAQTVNASGQVWAGTGNPDTSIHTGPGLNDGAWHHVVFTRSQATGRLTLYVDGAAVATGAGDTQALTAPPALRLGCLQSGLNFYHGAIADTAVYNRALPAPEIQAHFNVSR